MKRFATFMIAGLSASFVNLGQPAAQPEPAPAARPGEQAGAQPAEERTLLYATLMIQEAETQARAIEEMTSVSGVEALEVSELPREDASEDVLDSTVDEFTIRYLYEIARLREAMEDNEVVSDALAEADVELSRVVAAEINPDLSLTVYVDDT